MRYANAVLLSFEGPDAYSMVGGLGTRVTDLAAALAAQGVKTTLIFIGDPEKPTVERVSPPLEYRRWAQAISAQHPGGVYDGEFEKIDDVTAGVPRFILEEIVAPAARRRERTLVIAEEWQTAPAVVALDLLLRERTLRPDATLLWNANNTYGFERIDWNALRAAAQITTVSKYMKFILNTINVEPLVIPNGIAERLLGGANPTLTHALERALPKRPLFVKIGRYDPDKRWLQAVEAFALHHERQENARFIIRGGREAYGTMVLDRARALGVEVEAIRVGSREPQALIDALAGTRAPIVEIRSFVPESLLYALYRVADAVLANSEKEPFGLVGLEVMAAGGVAVCGATGEDYAKPFVNAIVCDTADPHELATYLEMASNIHLSHEIRAAGRQTAAHYAWSRVLTILERKLVYVEGEHVAPKENGVAV